MIMKIGWEVEKQFVIYFYFKKIVYASRKAINQDDPKLQSDQECLRDEKFGTALTDSDTENAKNSGTKCRNLSIG